MVGSERETNFFRCEERKHLRLSNHLCTQPSSLNSPHSTPLLHFHQLLLLFAKIHSSSQTLILLLLSPPADHTNPDEALKREVRRLDPTASILGALALGYICVTSDVFGVIGGGQGMLVTMNIIYKGYELWLKEQGAFFRRTLSAE